MTRTLTHWIAVWGAGGQSCDAIPDSSDHSRIFTLVAPTERQVTILSTYGVHLLNNSQPDYAVAYVRALRRLINNMSHREEESESNCSGSGNSTNESASDTKKSNSSSKRLFSDTQGENENENENENGGNEYSVTSSSLDKNIPKLWKTAADAVENLLQGRAMELFGATLQID